MKDNNEMTLRDIIASLGNKNYPYIECHIVYTHNNQEYDEEYGCCCYKDGQLISLDADSYSLDDIYFKWKEFEAKQDTPIQNNDKSLKYTIPKGTICLSVWEKGELVK